MREFNQNHQKYLKELKNFKIVQQGLTQAQNFGTFQQINLMYLQVKNLIGLKQSHEEYLKVAMGKIEQKREKETLNKADFAVIKAYAKEHQKTISRKL